MPQKVLHLKSINKEILHIVSFFLARYARISISSGIFLCRILHSPLPRSGQVTSVAGQKRTRNIDGTTTAARMSVKRAADCVVLRYFDSKEVTAVDHRKCRWAASPVNSSARLLSNLICGVVQAPLLAGT